MTTHGVLLKMEWLLWHTWKPFSRSTSPSITVEPVPRCASRENRTARRKFVNDGTSFELAGYTAITGSTRSPDCRMGREYSRLQQMGATVTA